MNEVRLRKGESIDKALRRFKRLCRDDLKELKKRRHYIKPSDSRKRRKNQKKGKKEQQQY
jgi:small subunit ribosomal protein S21